MTLRIIILQVDTALVVDPPAVNLLIAGGQIGAVLRARHVLSIAVRLARVDPHQSGAS